jgi:diguanylate cyclase (GGDEF)-like protein
VKYLAQWVFGSVSFGDNQEHHEFQYKLLSILLVTGALFTALFLVGAWSELNALSGPHIYSMIGFTSIALLLWLSLRNHPKRLIRTAWLYELICIIEYVSALWFVPQDELRILWFYINIPGVYIMLGQRAGFAITLLTIAIFLVSNAWLPDGSAYSPNALATAVLGVIYLALFFHFYVDRSMSYYVRMRESIHKMHHLATHDPLTGVLNARAYYTQCDRLISEAKQQETAFSVLFVDLDHFKRINDTYGHDAGDRVLKAVSGCLSGRLRKDDALGRIGGEEFSIFLPRTSLQEAVALAESIRVLLEALMPSIGTQSLAITASLGVAANRGHDQSMQSIQKEADQAMYHAKAMGRNRVYALESPTTG